MMLLSVCDPCTESQTCHVTPCGCLLTLLHMYIYALFVLKKDTNFCVCILYSYKYALFADDLPKVHGYSE